MHSPFPLTGIGSPLGMITGFSKGVSLLLIEEELGYETCFDTIKNSNKENDQKIYFLGIEVVKTKDGHVLSQRKYILDILNDCGKLGFKPSTFPIDQGLKLDKGEHEATVDASQYHPRKGHLEAANRVLRYLKAIPGQGILISRSGDLALKAYCDADWLGLFLYETLTYRIFSFTRWNTYLLEK
nr:hypothetical protein [Tanacetum cinerariifolium]